MKRIIVTLIMIAALTTSNVWAMLGMKEMKVHVENEQRSRYFEVPIKTTLLVSKPEEIIRSYFGLAQSEFEYHFDPRSNIHVIALKQQKKYEDFMAMRQLNMAKNINGLADAVGSQKYELIGEKLEEVGGLTKTEFGKDTLDFQIKQYFNGPLDTNNMGTELAKIDSIVCAIQAESSQQLSDDSKNVSKGIAGRFDAYFKKQLLRIIDGILIAYNLQSDAVINDITSQDMQFLKYALEHAREDSEQKSLIIGSWFDDKIKDLREDELKSIITHLKQWAVHYQSVENNFAHMLAQKQQGWQKISSLLMRNGVLKKVGLGALLIGVGFAASQLYEHLYGARVNEQPENAQA